MQQHIQFLQNESKTLIMETELLHIVLKSLLAQQMKISVIDDNMASCI